MEVRVLITEQAPPPAASASTPAFGTHGIVPGRHASCIRVRHIFRKIVALVVVDMGRAQQRSQDVAEASSGVEMIRVADSKAESEEFTDSSDGEHNSKEQALMLTLGTPVTSVYHGA